MQWSNQTHHALKVIREYLERENANEAVQYELEFMANQVTQSSRESSAGSKRAMYRPTT